MPPWCTLTTPISERRRHFSSRIRAYKRRRPGPGVSAFAAGGYLPSHSPWARRLFCGIIPESLGNPPLDIHFFSCYIDCILRKGLEKDAVRETQQRDAAMGCKRCQREPKQSPPWSRPPICRPGRDSPVTEDMSGITMPGERFTVHTSFGKEGREGTLSGASCTMEVGQKPERILPVCTQGVLSPCMQAGWNRGVHCAPHP